MADRMSEYTADVHKHRVAAWAACRAASTRRYPFSVKRGREWLHGGQTETEKEFTQILEEQVSSIDSQEEFGAWHHCRVAELTEFMTKPNSPASYGVAAKLLNLYLKIYFLHEISSADIGDKFSYFHPPFDHKMLVRFWGVARKEIPEKEPVDPSWSTHTEKKYKDTIDAMRQFTEKKKQPLWRIEAYWPGHQ